MNMRWIDCPKLVLRVRRQTWTEGKCWVPRRLPACRPWLFARDADWTNCDDYAMMHRAILSVWQCGSITSFVPVKVRWKRQRCVSYNPILIPASPETHTYPSNKTGRWAAWRRWILFYMLAILLFFLSKAQQWSYLKSAFCYFTLFPTSRILCLSSSVLSQRSAWEW